MIIIYDFGLVSSYEMTQWSVHLFYFFSFLVSILQIDRFQWKNCGIPPVDIPTDNWDSRTSLEIPVLAFFRRFTFDSPELDRSSSYYVVHDIVEGINHTRIGVSTTNVIVDEIIIMMASFDRETPLQYTILQNVHNISWAKCASMEITC